VLLVLVYCINVAVVRMCYVARASCCVLSQGHQINCMSTFRAAAIRRRCLLMSPSVTRKFITAAAADDDDDDDYDDYF